MSEASPHILVLYYSLHGAVKNMAEEIARGIDSVAGVSAKVRTVPPVSSKAENNPKPVPDEGAPYASNEDLQNCAGLALGSPTRFGSMAAAMKYFLDGTINEWLHGDLIGKPATVFSSSATMHGGQETTLFNLMTPLLHQGMVIVGVPYSEPALSSTKSGGTPYGSTHVTFGKDDTPLSDEEKQLCYAQGKRLAEIAIKLKN